MFRFFKALKCTALRGINLFPVLDVLLELWQAPSRLLCISLIYRLFVYLSYIARILIPQAAVKDR